MNVLIVVTHLLGTGHLARALNLARAIQDEGDRVLIVSGGMPVPHLDHGDVPFMQLPPLRSDGVDFTRLLNADNLLADDTTYAKRQAMLLETLHSQEWHVIITELFPFGRRVLRHEFLALLRAAKEMPTPPLICTSIRDILAPPSKPEKALKTDAIIEQLYDAVLVHADPDLTPLDLSWPVSDMLRPKLRYTGFVAPPPPEKHPKAEGKDEVIVTAGGGDVGTHIFAAALDAARTSDKVWRLLLGGKDAAKRAADLSLSAPENVIVEPVRPDFRQMLHHASACICMCGYNTALDLLQTGCPAVLIPFDEGNEVEQTLRAGALGKLDGFAILRRGALTPDALLACLKTVQEAPQRTISNGFDGAAQTAQILRKMHGDHP